MLSAGDSIFVITTTREFIMGLLGNGLIGLVTWIDWVKKKKLSSLDYTLTSLALSRICLICVIVLDIIIIFHPVFLSVKLRIAIDTFWMLSNHTSTWFGTCLSVFYFLKIANFSHPLFLWLKWRTDRAVVQILLGWLAISLLTFLILVTIVSCDYRFHILAKQKSNFIELFYVSKTELNVLTVFDLLGIIPFTGSLISFFRLMISLWRHTQQMKHKATGCRDSSMEAHVRAMKTVTLFTFLLFVYYLTFFWLTFSYCGTEKKLAVIFGETITILYPSGHSLILILGYNKLRQASARMLTCGKIACMT
ncbi:LOW QUALITY PROTEIN: taste receptor type 2 member 8 [Dugong dugon]